MKKLIIISVMLCLIAGAAFAQPSVGGNLKISTNLLAGSSEGEDVLAGGTTIWDAHTNIEWSGDNAGGMMRLFSKTNEWSAPYFLFWWWRPIEQVRLQLGCNRDMDFGHPQISGWSYNAEAQGGVAIDKDRDNLTIYGGGGYYGNESLASISRAAAWWGGFSDNLGLELSLFPMPGFEVDLCFPLISKVKEGSFGPAVTSEQAGGAPTIAETAEGVYLNSKINFKIGIQDVGVARLAVDLQGKATADDSIITPNVHLAFYVNAIDDMGIEIGAAFKDEFETIEIGAGYRLTVDEVGLKARVGLIAKQPGASPKYSPKYDKLQKDDMLFSIGILPSYKLEKFTGFFNAGFGINLNDTEVMDWFVNPYIQVPANSGSFYAGFKLLNLKSHGDDDNISWSIPIGWNVYF